jgi:hypothetical protein
MSSYLNQIARSHLFSLFVVRCRPLSAGCRPARALPAAKHHRQEVLARAFQPRAGHGLRRVLNWTQQCKDGGTLGVRGSQETWASVSPLSWPGLVCRMPSLSRAS